jgi:hypothetical protein
MYWGPKFSTPSEGEMGLSQLVTLVFCWVVVDTWDKSLQFLQVRTTALVRTPLRCHSNQLYQIQSQEKEVIDMPNSNRLRDLREIHVQLSNYQFHLDDLLSALNSMVVEDETVRSERKRLSHEIKRLQTSRDILFGRIKDLISIVRWCSI